ncbi:MAG: hypothetical protein Q4E42_01420 [Phascolarctobacterium sp.]|nr:hypothetical protein [Phascolarctobacterium sp.]
MEVRDSIGIPIGRFNKTPGGMSFNLAGSPQPSFIMSNQGENGLVFRSGNGMEFGRVKVVGPSWNKRFLNAYTGQEIGSILGNGKIASFCGANGLPTGVRAYNGPCGIRIGC